MVFAEGSFPGGCVGLDRATRPSTMPLVWWASSASSSTRLRVWATSASMRSSRDSSVQGGHGLRPGNVARRMIGGMSTPRKFSRDKLTGGRGRDQHIGQAQDRADVAPR